MLPTLGYRTFGGHGPFPFPVAPPILVSNPQGELHLQLVTVERDLGFMAIWLGLGNNPFAVAKQLEKQERANHSDHIKGCGLQPPPCREILCKKGRLCIRWVNERRPRVQGIFGVLAC